LKASKMVAELRKLEAELEAGNFASDDYAPPPPSPAPINPMLKIFASRLPVIELPTEEISSVDVARAEVKAKAEAQQKQEEKWVPVPRRNRFIDQSTSAFLEKQIKALFRITPNPQRCDSLSANWEYSDLVKAIQIVAEKQSGRPISHDGLFNAITLTLEGAA